MKQQAIYDQIFKKNDKLYKYVENRIKIRKSDFKFDFIGCYPQLMKEWFGKYDGETFNSQTLNLNFNETYTKWHTGTNYCPPWFFWYLAKNLEKPGKCYCFNIKGAKYKPINITIRSVGNSGKGRIEGKFKKKIGNTPWNVLK